MHNKHAFKRLQHKLMIAFLVLSITPLTLMAVFFLRSHSADLETQATTHLAFLRENKKEEIIQYFDDRRAEARFFSRSELATSSGGRFYGLIAAFHLLGETNEEAKTVARAHYAVSQNEDVHPLSLKKDRLIESERYSLLHKRYDWGFKEYLKGSDFSDILLVDIKGNVVYSAEKNASFGVNLLEDKWKKTALGQAFIQIREKTTQTDADINKLPIIFTDFAPSDKGEMEGWFAAAITQQGYLHSYALFKLPNLPLVKMLHEIPEDNKITTLLVGQDKLQRNAPPTPSLSPIKSNAIEDALSGKSHLGRFIGSNSERSLGAYAPLYLAEKPWALILELPEEEAFARIYQLERIFFILMLMAIFFVILASHLLSNSITAPLLRLTWAAEQVAAGDLDQKITSTDRKDEIGRLAVSFSRMQRSVREKLALIHEQNKELKQNIAIINQKNNDLQQTDRMKDDFLASTSHELRTPLHGMIGLAEALLADAEGHDKERQQAQLQMIINSGERLSNLIDDLLDYHKMRQGELEISPQAVDAANVIRLVIELSSHLIGGKHVRIINQVPIDLPLVRADEQRLEQILYNLMGNAIKYTDEGKVIISAILLEKQLRIQVIDTGQGIPPDELEYISEPLTTPTGVRSYRQGASLGLSISRQLIHIMGGHLYISSQPMVGTTLSFTLPLATKEDKAKTRLANFANNAHFLAPKQFISPSNAFSFPENPAGPLVIVVDDEPVNLQVLSNFLRLEGYRVKAVENGRQAIESVALEKPVLLLLDVMMPELSGFEVCTHLRERHSRSDLPIILLSALGQVQDKVKGFEAGANDYLIKPFNKYEISARIRAYIDASFTEQEREKNRSLTIAIQGQDDVEKQLLELQNQLFTLLDSAPEAIICVQENNKINYANQACTSLFKCKIEQLIQHPLHDFLETTLPALHENQEHIISEIKITLARSSIPIQAKMLRMPKNSEFHRMILFNSNIKATYQRVELLENAVDTLANYTFHGDIEKLQELKDLGEEFTHMVDKFTHTKKDETEQLREILVKVMSATLNHWKKSTGKTKFDLAEESGLWRVYLDRSTLQTRTLDKYLNVKTVPKSPRWRSVMSTIDFVITKCPEPNNDLEKLLILKERLQILILREPVTV